MTIGTTTTWTNQVKPHYDADYLLANVKTAIWDQFPDYKSTVEADKGSSHNFVVANKMSPRTTALTQSADITPRTYSDTEISITFDEYADGVQHTLMAELQTYTDLGKQIAEVLGQSRAETMDMVIRNTLMAATNQVLYINANTGRTSLDRTTDLVTYEFLTQLVSQARQAAMPTDANGFYYLVVPPIFTPEIQNLPGFLSHQQYNDPESFMNGEIGANIAGVRIFQHHYAKIALGEGATAQTATTLDGAHSAGATTVNVASASGIVAGNYVTIDGANASGAAEPVTEQVFVTAVSSNALTIRGGGNTFTNFGLIFDHATGVNVVEADNVVPLLLFGPKSLPALWSTRTGREGKMFMKPAESFIPDRFFDAGWHQIAGYELLEKWTLRGEVAVKQFLIGNNN